MPQPIHPLDLPLHGRGKFAVVVRQLGEPEWSDRQRRALVGAAVPDRHELDATPAEIAHDVRGRLGAIATATYAARLVAGRDPDPRLAAALDLIERQVQEAARLLSELGMLGRTPPGYLPQGVAEGEWYRLVTAMFLHQEIPHIAFNMLSLWWLGPPLEAALGRLRFTALYMLSGLGGSALTYLVARFGYLAVSAAVAAAVMFLLDVNPAAAGAPLKDLLFAVVIGGGLAVVAHVVLPDHGLIRLHQRAGELLKSEIDYAAAVVKAFVHELDHPADALSAAWQRAFRARAAFEAASGATRADSRELRRWLRSYRAALNAVTNACTNLETTLTSAPSTALTPGFVAAVDDYVDALRGAPPSPAKPWTVDIDELTAANQQVREQGARLAADNAAARVLVAEVAAITRSLTGIAATRLPAA